MTPFERWSVWITTAVVAATGIVLGVMEYLLDPVDPWAVVHHPWQPAVLKIHLLSAPLLVFAIGMITLRHVWRHFVSRTPHARGSGLTTALMVAPMVISGYLIQVLTHPGWLAAMAIGHLACGLVYLGGLAVHQRMVRRGSPGGPDHANGAERASRRSAPGPARPPAPRPAAGPRSRPTPAR